MGRLYDKQDLIWNLAFWDRQEANLHMQIANGQIPASILDRPVAYPARCNCLVPCGRPHHNYLKVGRAYASWSGPQKGRKTRRIETAFDQERRRERMKLLKTGTLLQELDRMLKLFKACPNCYVEKTTKGDKDRACDVHRDALGAAKSAVYWAGEHNIAEREARGQRRADGVATAQEVLEGELPNTESKGLNHWETEYQREQREGFWPGRQIWADRQVARGRHPADELAWMKEEYGSLDYRGYLQMLLQNEEISQDEYHSELGRIRAGNEDTGLEVRDSARKRDTRFNAPFGGSATRSGYTGLT